MRQKKIDGPPFTTPVLSMTMVDFLLQTARRPHVNRKITHERYLSMMSDGAPKAKKLLALRRTPHPRPSPQACAGERTCQKTWPFHLACRRPVADLPAVGGTVSYGGLPAIASWLFMSPQWRICTPVCAALLHDHSFKQLRRHPAAEFWDAAAFCGWPQDCAEPARTQPEREGFPQPLGYPQHHCAIKLPHGGAVGFAQASHEQYRNTDKRV